MSIKILTSLCQMEEIAHMDYDLRCMFIRCIACFWDPAVRVCSFEAVKGSQAEVTSCLS